MNKAAFFLCVILTSLNSSCNKTLLITIADLEGALACLDSKEPVESTSAQHQGSDKPQEYTIRRYRGMIADSDILNIYPNLPEMVQIINKERSPHEQKVFKMNIASLTMKGSLDESHREKARCIVNILRGLASECQARNYIAGYVKTNKKESL